MQVHYLKTKCVMTPNLMHYNYVIYAYNYVVYRVDCRKRSKTIENVSVGADIFKRISAPGSSFRLK